MRIAELEDVTYDLEVDGEQVRRTLRRRVWERRGWATVALVFEERGPDGAWRPARLALIRLQRSGDGWKKHAAVALSGPEAAALGAAIGEWAGELGGAPEDE